MRHDIDLEKFTRLESEQEAHTEKMRGLNARILESVYRARDQRRQSIDGGPLMYSDVSIDEVLSLSLDELKFNRIDVIAARAAQAATIRVKTLTAERDRLSAAFADQGKLFHAIAKYAEADR